MPKVSLLRTRATIDGSYAFRFGQAQTAEAQPYKEKTLWSAKIPSEPARGGR